MAMAFVKCGRWPSDLACHRPHKVVAILEVSKAKPKYGVAILDNGNT
ncbi:MAG: hypothetical protein LBQ05_02195 [Christensenellaceae bacterium]|nr:hypothetical protein [Christensenellaceae bacterium]